MGQQGLLTEIWACLYPVLICAVPQNGGEFLYFFSVFRFSHGVIFSSLVLCLWVLYFLCSGNLDKILFPRVWKCWFNNFSLLVFSQRLCARVCVWKGVLFLAIRKCRIEFVPHIFGILLFFFINLVFVGSVCLERHYVDQRFRHLI